VKLVVVLGAACTGIVGCDWLTIFRGADDDIGGGEDAIGDGGDDDGGWYAGHNTSPIKVPLSSLEPVNIIDTLLPHGPLMIMFAGAGNPLIPQLLVVGRSEVCMPVSV
jgi:hypothetical protein